MTGQNVVRKVWHRLPAPVRRSIWSVYFSFREVASLPWDLWVTPHISSGDFDYDEYWTTRGRSTIQPRDTLISGAVEEGSSVLEIGCGDGFLMELLTRTRKARCQGYDISPESVSMAKKRGLDAKIADAMSSEFSIDSVYDYVVACELLEHLSSPEKMILKLRGSFKQALIVSVPNVAYFKHRLRLLCGRFPLQWGWHPSEHLRYWSVRDFRWWSSEL